MSDNRRTTGKAMFTLVAGVLVVTALMFLKSRPASAHIIPVPCDFTTGGGFVIKDSGAKANFGFVAGCKHGAFFGHVNYVDHETGLHVSSDSITGYTEPSATETTRRDICGEADTNLFGTVGYHVVVVDNGEPGVNDHFGIALSNGYIVTTRTLAGGNIEIHKPNRSTTAPSTFVECSTVAPDPGP
jgi:hypothetical protein